MVMADGASPNNLKGAYFDPRLNQPWAWEIVDMSPAVNGCLGVGLTGHLGNDVAQTRGHNHGWWWQCVSNRAVVIQKMRDVGDE